jgi:hypothetical protein
MIRFMIGSRRSSDSENRSDLCLYSRRLEAFSEANPSPIAGDHVTGFDTGHFNQFVHDAFGQIEVGVHDPEVEVGGEVPVDLEGDETSGRWDDRSDRHYVDFAIVIEDEISVFGLGIIGVFRPSTQWMFPPFPADLMSFTHIFIPHKNAA